MGGWRASVLPGSREDSGGKGRGNLVFALRWGRFAEQLLEDSLDCGECLFAQRVAVLLAEVMEGAAGAVARRARAEAGDEVAQRCAQAAACGAAAGEEQAAGGGLPGGGEERQRFGEPGEGVLELSVALGLEGGAFARPCCAWKRRTRAAK
jgi:hypothetical protein